MHAIVNDGDPNGKMYHEKNTRDILKKMGFSDNSVNVIFRCREKMGLIADNRVFPDIFSVASASVMLTFSGYDIDFPNQLQWTDDQARAFARYRKDCTWRIRKKFGIKHERVKNRTASIFNSISQLVKPILDEHYEFLPLKNVATKKFQRGERPIECWYCGKEISSDNAYKETCCDRICWNLKSKTYRTSPVYPITHYLRLTNQDYQLYIGEPLSRFNKMYNRNVNSKDFLDALRDVISAHPCLGSERLYFNAYYIAARKNCTTYITFHDMHVDASKNLKWKGAKQEMMEQTSCKMENRITSIFKKSCAEIIKAGIIEAKEENRILSSFDAIHAHEIIFRSNPKTVAITLLVVILEKLGITYHQKSFYRVLKISRATVWKKEKIAAKIIENPSLYWKKKKPTFKPSIKKAEIIVKEMPKVASLYTPVITMPETKHAESQALASEFKEMIKNFQEKMLPGMSITDMLSDVAGKEKKIQAVYIDLNNFYYVGTKNNADKFNITKLLKAIVKAIITIDSAFKIENFIGYVYCSPHLFFLRQHFFNIGKTTTDPLIKKIIDNFKWFTPNQKKFKDGKETEQDSDTFLVARAIREIVEHKNEMKHVILVAADMDLSPVLMEARERKMKTTVISYQDKIASIMMQYIDNPIYIENIK